MRRSGTPGEPETIETNSIDPQWVYAGFWIRVWAAIVDSVLLLIVLWPLMSWLVPEIDTTVTTDAVSGNLGQIDYGALFVSNGIWPTGPMDFLVNWVLPAVVILLFWIYRDATPGKILIGAQIRDAATGQSASKRQLVGRYLGYYVSSLPLGLGLIWVGLDRRKQGWHDKLAGTVVVRRSAIRQPVTDFRPPDDAPSEPPR